MNDKPPLLPVLIGAAAVGFGLVNGSIFTIWAVIALSDGAEPPSHAATMVPGLLVMMDAFTLLQIPAGFGVLLHRDWGRKLAPASVLGATVTGLLGSGLGYLGIAGPPNAVMGTFPWGFVTGLVWAVTMNFALRSRPMRAAFGDDVPPGAPPATG